MPDNAEYTTIKGDRWDTVALKAYGDDSDFNDIQDANPNIAITDIFEGGVKLIVPIREEDQTNNLDKLPPWKRVQAELSPEVQQVAESLANITPVPESFDKSFD